ncbi:MAG: 16S rRNA (guanine(527)-N(7))-methyltransferase RsmG [SAR202 cluster bacterium]|nr:16S rRNA (guanine(527)-N(7))-methyltransferase RsmG [SAR202 cluster bacterium]
MDLLRRHATALGITLNDAQLDQFQRFYQELTNWNQRFNLTRITGYDDVQIKHFLDSLTAASVIPQVAKDGGRFVDIGAGAGLPGLALKIAFPAIRLTLIEATGKKANFLRHVVQALGLDSVEVEAERSEVLAQDPRFRQQFDVALARALAPMAPLAEMALPFCKTGGIVVAYKKGDIDAELAAARRAIATVGGEMLRRHEVDVEGLRDGRCLVVLRKARPTPSEYPRRPGTPQKSPL